MKVNLSGHDGLGYWFLHDQDGNVFPLVVKDEDHPIAAALFGWIENEDLNEADSIESARLWLMECIGDEITAPAHVQEFFIELRGEE